MLKTEHNLEAIFSMRQYKDLGVIGAMLKMRTISMEVEKVLFRFPNLKADTTIWF